MGNKLTNESSDIIARIIEENSDIEFSDRFLSVLNLVPWVGGLLSSWFSQNRLQVKLDRIQECILLVVDKLEAIDEEFTEPEGDQESFYEISTQILRKVSQIINDEKREYYSNLLANVALTKSSHEREKVQSMATLLDQLELIHLKTLDSLMDLKYTQSVHFFGPVRVIYNFDANEFSKEEHHAMGTLQELGILDLSAFPIGKGKFEGEVRINSRGIALHKWITKPEK